MLLSVTAFVSLDGVMQGPAAVDEDPSGGFTRGGWLVPYASAGIDAIVRGWLGEADALLLGRRTFERMRAHWPAAADPDDPVANALSDGRASVISSTLTGTQLGGLPVTVLRGDAIQEACALADAPGREVQVHGSRRLARALHDAGVVDVYRLVQVPVVLGQGKRLFEDGALPSAYRVDAAQSALLPDGAVALTLRRSAWLRPGRPAVAAASGRHAATPH